MCSGPESGNEGGGNSLISKVSTVSTPVVEAGNSSKKQKSKEKAICSPNLLQTPTSAPSSESQPLPIRNRILPDCNDKQPMTTTPKTNQSNPFMFEMPVPSLKMGSLTPICSPTTENKLYAGVDLSFKMLSTLQTIDLNVRSFEAEYNNSPIKKKNANLGSLAPSHWALGLDHPHKDSYITHPFFEWLATTNSGELHRCWVMHELPRFIELKGHKLQEEFTQPHFMSDDVFDIAIRRYKQLDHAMHPSNSGTCWRHFLESDFAKHALAEEKPLNNVPVREQFVDAACSLYL